MYLYNMVMYRQTNLEKEILNHKILTNKKKVYDGRQHITKSPWLDWIGYCFRRLHLTLLSSPLYITYIHMYTGTCEYVPYW